MIEEVLSTIPLDPNEYVLTGSLAVYLQIMNNSTLTNLFLNSHGGIKDVDLILPRNAHEKIGNSEKLARNAYRDGFRVLIMLDDPSPFREQYVLIDAIKTVSDEEFSETLEKSRMLEMDGVTVYATDIREILQIGIEKYLKQDYSRLMPYCKNGDYLNF